MSKKALVLFAQISINNKLCDPPELIRILNQNVSTDTEFYWAALEDLLFDVSNNSIGITDIRNGHFLDEYSVVNFRFWGEAQGHAMAAARYCHERGIRFVDTEALRTGSFNKITQYVNLHYAEVPIPKSLIGSGDNLLASYAERGFVFPLIAKSVAGTRGKDNYLVHTHEELAEILTHAEKAFVLQEYIPNTGDYRVLVTGDTATFVLHRQATTSSHLNNTSQGGKPTPVPIESVNPKVISLAIKASQYYGRDFGGVDIVESSVDGSFYCFEVNRSPQIEGTAYADEKAKVLADFLAG